MSSCCLWRLLRVLVLRRVLAVTFRESASSRISKLPRFHLCVWRDKTFGPLSRNSGYSNTVRNVFIAVTEHCCQMFHSSPTRSGITFLRKLCCSLKCLDARRVLQPSLVPFLLIIIAVLCNFIFNWTCDCFKL